MQIESVFQRIMRWMVLIMLLSFGYAMAQGEPTMAEVYATAKAGKLEQAQVMVQQVLISHPKSAKAHFVQSELYARQGNLPRARDALARAEEIAPGLPFAKPEAVQSLRSQLKVMSTPPSALSAAPVGVPTQYATSAKAPSTSPSSNAWLLPVLLTVGVMALGYFIFRKRTPDTGLAQPAYAAGLNGPQNFGGGGATVMQPPYGQPAYGQPGYAQPAGSGLGGRIMGGVATGLAVGAGVMAAEAIGKTLMGGHESPARAPESNVNNDYQPLASNTDMGGQNFGVNDSSSWDDGGSVDSGGGGGDWDN
jgi:hypothetical protein